MMKAMISSYVAVAIIASNKAPVVKLAKVLATPEKTQTPSILLAL